MNIAEKQVTIYGKVVKLMGSVGDTYFESHIDERGLSEKDILNLLTVCVGEDDVVVDVGANIGYVTIASAILAPKGRVFAYEPAAVTFKILEQNMQQNSLSQVRAYKIGLSDTKAMATLSSNANNSSGAFVDDGVGKGVSNHTIDRINLIRLDDVYKKHGIKKCALLKVDVEGHEPNFFRGATKFIKSFKPEVIVEANHWCLNVFNRTSLPDFIEQVFEHFPHVFALHDGSYLDLSDENARYQFFYKNTVNNSYMNLYGGFDRQQMLRRLNASFIDWSVAREENRKHAEEVKKLEEKIVRLEAQVELLENRPSRKLVSKVSSIIRGE